MTSWDKLENKIISLDKNTRFDELAKVLMKYGYTMKYPRGGSSHATFRKPGEPPITVPRHSPIKIVYLKLVRELILKEGDHYDN